MNEAQVGERLRRAIGEARYPAYLSTRIAARLDHAAHERHPRVALGRTQNPWLAGVGRTVSLVAALLVVLIMASLVLGLHAWFMNTRPAVPDGLAIKQYQALVRADQQMLDSQPGGYCAITDTGCPAVAALNTAAMQRWLDDLDRSQPPARFAVLDSLMRRHLAIAISDQNAAMAAYRARDQLGVNTAFGAGSKELDTVDSQAQDIITSSPGTIVTYRAEVRMDAAYLLGCYLCQPLLGDSQVSCQGSLTPACADEIAAVRLQVETFQGDLVNLFAPDSLAAEDGRLQADLVAADLALDAMESALSARDQVALQAGHNALGQAINRVASDAADIG